MSRFIMACEVCKKPYILSTDDNTFDTDKKPHVCNTCGRSFSLKIQLKRHILTHADGAPYVCVTCEKNEKEGDPKTYNLRLSQKGNFTCETCQKCFTTKRLLLRHATEHTIENLIECGECGESFKNAASLKKHAVIHKPKRVNSKIGSVKKIRICDDCGQTFSRLQEFKRHCLIHKTIQHENSNADLIQSENIENHYDNHNFKKYSENNSDTPNESKNSASDSECRKHTCEVCDKSFARKSALEGHMVSHFSDNRESPFEDDSDVDADFLCSYKENKSNEQSKRLCLPKLKISLTFPCEKCKKICASKKLLDKHLISCSGTSQKSPPREKQYRCCNEEFDSKEDYKKHKLSLHPKSQDEKSVNKEQKTHTCKICLKVFLKRKSLRKHRELHFQTDAQESESLFRRSSSSKDNLGKRRQRSKDYSCSICGKRFAGETCLKKHEAKHTGDNNSEQVKVKKGKTPKVLICEVCNEDYTGRSHAFAKHKLSHTPEVCGICDARFADRASLREHCRIHIGTEEGRKFLECSQKLFNAKHNITQPEPKVEYIYLVLR